MPYGWIALGFGQAFFFPILVLGQVSAFINPAACLGAWVIGTPEHLIACVKLILYFSAEPVHCYLYLRIVSSGPHKQTLAPILLAAGRCTSNSCDST
jgi:hypothetical protein